MALMVCLASLVCGAAIYPVVVRLAEANERKARFVLESHIAMMEATNLAPALRAQLEGLDEEGVKGLMRDMVHRHFDTLQ